MNFTFEIKENNESKANGNLFYNKEMSYSWDMEEDNSLFLEDKFGSNCYTKNDTLLDNPFYDFTKLSKENEFSVPEPNVMQHGYMLKDKLCAVNQEREAPSPKSNLDGQIENVENRRNSVDKPIKKSLKESKPNLMKKSSNSMIKMRVLKNKRCSASSTLIAQPKDAKNITEIIDDILDKPNKKRRKELSVRRDVINKRILRGFKKFIARQFDSIRIRPCRMKKEKDDFKPSLIQQAIKIGLINQNSNVDNNTNEEEFKEFICWMAMSKNTVKTKNLFDYNNRSIFRLGEVLAKYSHGKLESLYEDSSIKKVYEYFVLNGMRDFLRSIPKGKRSLYEETIVEMYNNFNNKAC